MTMMTGKRSSSDNNNTQRHASRFIQMKATPRVRTRRRSAGKSARLEKFLAERRERTRDSTSPPPPASPDSPAPSTTTRAASAANFHNAADVMRAILMRVPCGALLATSASLQADLEKRWIATGGGNFDFEESTLALLNDIVVLRSGEPEAVDTEETIGLKVQVERLLTEKAALQSRLTAAAVRASASAQALARATQQQERPSRLTTPPARTAAAPVLIADDRGGRSGSALVHFFETSSEEDSEEEEGDGAAADADAAARRTMPLPLLSSSSSSPPPRSATASATASATTDSGPYADLAAELATARVENARLVETLQRRSARRRSISARRKTVRAQALEELESATATPLPDHRGGGSTTSSPVALRLWGAARSPEGGGGAAATPQIKRLRGDVEALLAQLREGGEAPSGGSAARAAAELLRRTARTLTAQAAAAAAVGVRGRPLSASAASSAALVAMTTRVADLEAERSAAWATRSALEEQVAALDSRAAALEVNLEDETSRSMALRVELLESKARVWEVEVEQMADGLQGSIAAAATTDSASLLSAPRRHRSPAAQLRFPPRAPVRCPPPTVAVAAAAVVEVVEDTGGGGAAPPSVLRNLVAQRRKVQSSFDEQRYRAQRFADALAAEAEERAAAAAAAAAEVPGGAHSAPAARERFATMATRTRHAVRKSAAMGVSVASRRSSLGSFAGASDPFLDRFLRTQTRCHHPASPIAAVQYF